jgi:NADPH:quinone reductase-like Zn-dependent oxidoreductase
MLALVADPETELGMALREVPDPEPGHDEVLVEQHATSVNRGEVRRLPSREPGFVTGWDVAGTVVRAARDGGPPEGARVAGIVRGGAWAERVAVPIDAVAEIPDGLTFAQAATLPVAGVTAVRALAQGGLLLGRRVLITGGAGGVGRFAIQLARRAGAHVTAVAGSEERAQGLDRLGADEVVVGFEQDGPRFDLILESAGGESLVAALNRVAPQGTIVAFGNSSGDETTFNVSAFYSQPGARLYGLMVFDEIRLKDSGPRDLRLLAELAAAGELDTEITLETSWREPEEAMRALMERRVSGKAVLHMR